jgi:hypothetical protein
MAIADVYLYVMQLEGAPVNVADASVRRQQQGKLRAELQTALQQFQATSQVMMTKRERGSDID